MARLTIQEANKIHSLTSKPNALYEKPNNPLSPFTSLNPTHLPAKDRLSGAPNKPRIPTRSSDAGYLVAIPLELQRQILLHCDFATLGSLRLVNYYFYSAILRIKEYEELTTHPWDAVCRHASATLKVMKDVEVLGYHSLADVHRVFMSSTCTWCGDYTPFVFLFSFERACVPCLRRDERARMIDAGMARRVFGVSEERLEEEVKSGMKSLHSLNVQSGYSKRDRVIECSFDNRVRLYLASDVERLAMRVHGSREEIKRVIGLQFEQEMRGYEWEKIAEQERDQKWNLAKKPENPLWALEPETTPDYDPEDAARFQHNILDRYRCMTSTAMPILNQDVTAWPRVEAGVWCKGCCRNYNIWMDMEKRPSERDASWREGWTPQLKGLERAMLKAWSQEGYLYVHSEGCATGRAQWGSLGW